MPPAHCPSPRRRWELWNLQALDPDASDATLAALESGRRACDELARRILPDGEGDHGRLRAEARAFLAAHRVPPTTACAPTPTGSAGRWACPANPSGW